MGGGGGGKSKVPDVPKVKPPADPNVSEPMKRARDAQRKLAQAGTGYSGTMLTGGGGVMGEARTAKKTLLGQ